MTAKLNAEERKRLKKISNSLDWRFSISVSRHFNEAGKGDAFSTAATKDEEDAQMKLISSVLAGNVWADVKTTDIFLAAARRVGNDAELAALLPADIDEKDANLLEKCKLKDLAALVRLKR